MWPYPWTHVGTPSHLGHMDRVAATMPSQAHAGAAQEAPDIGQWEGQDVPLVRPSSCNVKGGIPSSRRYLPTYLWERHVGARGGRLLPGCGASGVGRYPTPDRSPFPLPGGCWCGGCGRGDPSPTPQRALLRAGIARCGGSMRVPGGGGCLLPGRPVSGALSPPTTRPFGRAAGVHYLVAVGAGGAGVGTRDQPHSARSCELALRAVGAA